MDKQMGRGRQMLNALCPKCQGIVRTQYKGSIYIPHIDPNLLSNILALRKEGKTNHEIGESLGMTGRRVNQIVQNYANEKQHQGGGD